MNYLDSGYNQYFQRELTPGENQTTSFDRDVSEGGFSGDRIEGGTLKSATGDTTFNLTEGYLSVSSGGVERVRIGNINNTDGTGMQIKDKDGKVIMQISENGNFIQGASTNLRLDFNEEHILVKDNGLPRVLIGKHVGGF